MKKSKGVNYHSGEKVDDLVKQVKDADHKKVEGETQKDSNYEKEMYSEEQMERQKTMDNIFKVDNVPSRWEHNKLRSTWHFDTFADPHEKTFVVTNRFVGDFDEAIEYALSMPFTPNVQYCPGLKEYSGGLVTHILIIRSLISSLLTILV